MGGAKKIYFYVAGLLPGDQLSIVVSKNAVSLLLPFSPLGPLQRSLEDSETWHRAAAGVYPVPYPCEPRPHNSVQEYNL